MSLFKWMHGAVVCLFGLNYSSSHLVAFFIAGEIFVNYIKRYDNIIALSVTGMAILPSPQRKCSCGDHGQ